MFAIIFSYREYKIDMGLWSYNVPMKNDEHAKNLLATAWPMWTLVIMLLITAFCGVFNTYCFSIFIVSQRIPLPLHNWIRWQFRFYLFSRPTAQMLGMPFTTHSVYTGGLNRFNRYGTTSAYTTAYDPRTSYLPTAGRSECSTTVRTSFVSHRDTSYYP